MRAPLLLLGPWLGVLGSIVAPGAARATGSAEAAADALFVEGRAAMARGEHALACAKLEASQALDPAVGTRLNLADCKEALNDIVAAWQHLRSAVVELASRDDDRLDFARARLAEVERRLPRLTIRLDPSAPPGTRVLRDGVEQPPGSFGSSLPVNPGEHVVEVTAPGHAPRRIRVGLAEGQRRDILATPGPSSARGGGPAPAAQESASQRTWGWISVGAGATGVLVGVVTGVMALESSSTLEAACARSNGQGARLCPSTHQGDLETFRAARVVSWVGFGAGVAGLSLGIVLHATAPSSSEDGGPPRRARRAPSAARAALVVQPGFAGIRGVF